MKNLSFDYFHNLIEKPMAETIDQRTMSRTFGKMDNRLDQTVEIQINNRVSEICLEAEQ